jgi:hypothetical protein
MLDRLLKYFRKDKPAVQVEPKPVHPAMKAPIVRVPELHDDGMKINGTGTFTHVPTNQPELPKIPRGWTKWDGKECPVKLGTLVDVMYRDGLRKISLPALKIGKAARDASFAFWDTTDGADNDIIAYRVRKPVKNQKVFSQKAKTKAKRKTVTVKKRAGK